MCLSWLVHRVRRCLPSKRPAKVYEDTDKSTTFTQSKLILPLSEEHLFTKQIESLKASKLLQKAIITKKCEGISKVGRGFFHRLMIKRRCKDVLSPEEVQHFADIAGVLIYAKSVWTVRTKSSQLAG